METLFGVVVVAVAAGMCGVAVGCLWAGKAHQDDLDDLAELLVGRACRAEEKAESWRLEAGRNWNLACEYRKALHKAGLMVTRKDGSEYWRRDQNWADGPEERQ